MRKNQTQMKQGSESVSPSSSLSSLSSHSPAVFRRVISRQITGAARTCPLSAVWIFHEWMGEYKEVQGLVGCGIVFHLLRRDWIETTVFKKSKSMFFIVLFFFFFLLKAKPFFSFLAISQLLQ